MLLVLSDDVMNTSVAVCCRYSELDISYRTRLMRLFIRYKNHV